MSVTDDGAPLFSTSHPAPVVQQQVNDAYQAAYFYESRGMQRPRWARRVIDRHERGFRHDLSRDAIETVEIEVLT